ncbi:uncharacterized protein PRCAT00001877001 [Priceomyces carsonii]|uniref:uncharacterized protein n=1 Tax=Priceomyces carsonii TaxID=28549 RepID=UPI002EDB88C1|nr:unnamed protein product [Priceomyces carsonii]
MIRERITIFNPTDSSESVIRSLNSTDITLERGLNLAQERKLHVLGFNLGIKNLKFMRIQMVKEQFPETIFNQRYSYGISIYFAPRELRSTDEETAFITDITSLVNDLFELKVDIKSWIISYNAFYLYLEDFDTSHFLEAIEKKLNDQTIRDYSNIDLFLDEKQELTVKSLRHVNSTSHFTKEDHKRKEIGIFRIDDSSSQDDLILRGLRVILANESEVKNVHNTMFHVKPRNRELKVGYLTSVKPNGLHPVLVTDFKSPLIFPMDNDIEKCKLYMYMNLEKSLFLDEYQLPPTLKLILKLGNSDMESPEYTHSQWGNEILLEVNDTGLEKIELPLHARYRRTSQGETKSQVGIGSPIVFYGCDVEEPDLLSISPFDSKKAVGGNYESLFTDNAVFYHFELQKSDLSLEVPVASLRIESAATTTVMAVSFGLIFILAVLSKSFFGKSQKRQERKVSNTTSVDSSKTKKLSETKIEPETDTDNLESKSELD